MLLLRVLVLAIVVVLLAQAASASSCSALPRGYYTPNEVLKSGSPPPATPTYSYTLKPDFLSCAEVASLHQYCVARVNKYRTGELSFTNGQSPSSSSLPARDVAVLQEPVANRKCAAEISLGDFAIMGQAGGECGAGAHKTAWACKDMGGSQGQNACCPRLAGVSVAGVALAIDQCLQQMWNNRGGHHDTMRSEAYKYVSCGFAFGKNDAGENIVNINQNFASEFQATARPTKPPVDPLGGVVMLTPAPIRLPTRKPTNWPTSKPTTRPTPPSRKPTRKPTKAPTQKPTRKPTKWPTTRPTATNKKKKL